MCEIFHTDALLQCDPAICLDQSQECLSRQNVYYAFYSPSSILPPPLNETASKQSLPHCNATPTRLHVSSKLSCHAVPHVNRTRTCCHSPMYRDCVRSHGLSSHLCIIRANRCMRVSLADQRFDRRCGGGVAFVLHPSARRALHSIAIRSIGGKNQWV